MHSLIVEDEYIAASSNKVGSMFALDVEPMFFFFGLNQPGSTRRVGCMEDEERCDGLPEMNHQAPFL